MDELMSNIIIEMNWVEFLEAITRMADKFSPAPYLVDTVIPYEKRFFNSFWFKLKF